MRESTTSRGFRVVQFEDSYGQICSLQESSSVDPHLWIGVENTGPVLKGPGGQVSEQVDARMHIDTETAIAIRAELDAFIGDRETEKNTEPDDRARRIRELVRDWAGNKSWSTASADHVDFEHAARIIDAIDDAEVPEKAGAK